MMLAPPVLAELFVKAKGNTNLLAQQTKTVMAAS
jgi:hypothetical protein